MIRTNRTTIKEQELAIAILSTLSAMLALGLAFSICILSATSEARKAEPTALMCFDAYGAPTVGNDFTHCERVAYRVER